MAVAEIPVTEHYRALILSAGGVLTSGLLVLSEALVNGRPLGGVELVAVLVAVVTSLGVYYPASPWAKFGAAVAGAIGQTLISAFTDGRFTPAELVTIAIMGLGALGIGAFPNAPALVVGEPGDGGAYPITGVDYAEPAADDAGQANLYGLGGVILAVLLVLVFLKVFGVL